MRGEGEPGNEAKSRVSRRLFLDFDSLILEKTFRSKVMAPICK